MSQLKQGALLTYLKIGVTNIVGLILTPYIIKTLGDSEYGLYVLVGSIIAYLGLMNLGINNATVRYVAKYKALDDKESEKIFLSTTMWLYLMISGLIIIIGWAIYLNLEDIFSKSLSPDEIEKVKTMFVILVFNMSIALPGGTYFAICGAYERFVFPSTVMISKYILRSLAVFLVLYLGGDALSIVITDTIFSLAIIVVSFIYVRKILKISISLKFFNKKLIGNILSYSLWVFLFGIVYKFQWNAGQIVLGINNNTTLVAIFGVSVLLGGYYGAFAGAINGVLVPRATQMVVKNSHGKELTQAMIKIGRMNTYILGIILSGFILFGQSFITLWVGESYMEAYIISLLFMSVMTLPLIQAFGNSILEGMRKNRFKSLLSVITVGVGVLTGFYLSPKYGLIGMAIPLVSAMFVNSIIMNFYYKKTFGFEIISFFKDTILYPLLIYAPLIYIFELFINPFHLETWLGLILYAVIYSILFCALTYTLLMNNYEKGLIKKFISFKK
ncbi:oligosaccharide flippase family protein [Flagellimonas marinaquae]|uniref:oligosaccharide flippase family protein n=1 Tax=Flagellimonas aurea TaxID=2915619 RepID=UPI001CE10484|nr:oligosaccharide flippase family protein [Allomuricauda aquimarina]